MMRYNELGLKDVKEIAILKKEKKKDGNSFQMNL